MFTMFSSNVLIFMNEGSGSSLWGKKQKGKKGTRQTDEGFYGSEYEARAESRRHRWPV